MLTITVQLNGKRLSTNSSWDFDDDTITDLPQMNIFPSHFPRELVIERVTKLIGNCNLRLENSRLQTGRLQMGHFEMPRFLCSELQRLD